MELRNRTTGAVITEDEFRRDNRNTSFPEVLTPQIIDSFGYDPVLEGPQATTVPPYDGVVHTAAEQYEAYCFAKDTEQGKTVRADRNKRLADCDWTQLPDAPVDRTAWAAYRQELRNVPQQEGFPWNVIWPEQPGF